MRGKILIRFTCPLLLAVAGCGDDSEPFTVSDANLAGVIGGQDWEFVQGSTEPALSDEEFFTKLNASTYTACEPFAEPTAPRVVVSLPKVPGEWRLGASRSVTFFEPPGENTIAMEGRIEVYEVTDTVVRAGMHAVFDSLYTVNGRFEAGICPE